eukprot:gene5305-8923_t
MKEQVAQSCTLEKQKTSPGFVHFILSGPKENTNSMKYKIQNVIQENDKEGIKRLEERSELISLLMRRLEDQRKDSFNTALRRTQNDMEWTETNTTYTNSDYCYQNDFQKAYPTEPGPFPSICNCSKCKY